MDFEINLYFSLTEVVWHLGAVSKCEEVLRKKHVWPPPYPLIKEHYSENLRMDFEKIEYFKLLSGLMVIIYGK